MPISRTISSFIYYIVVMKECTKAGNRRPGGRQTIINIDANHFEGTVEHVMALLLCFDVTRPAHVSDSPGQIQKQLDTWSSYMTSLGTNLSHGLCQLKNRWHISDLQNCQGRASEPVLKIWHGRQGSAAARHTDERGAVSHCQCMLVTAHDGDPKSHPLHNDTARSRTIIHREKSDS